jgi:hypothetical protein
MNEEGANFGSVVLRVEQDRLAARPLVAAIKGFSFAPAAAAYDDWRPSRWLRGRVARDHIRFFLRDEIGSVGDELSIHAIHRRQGALNLGWSVVPRLQSANRGVDQRSQYWNVCGNGLAYADLHSCGYLTSRIQTEVRLSAAKRWQDGCTSGV